MAKNHPLMKDVKNWVLDSFSFMDGIGYDIQFEDDIFGMENTKAFSIDIDGLTDYDFEKGKENLIKSVPKKIKAEFPYLRISSTRDGNYFVMFITLLDNNDYLEDTKLTYINLNESKKSVRNSLKEEKATDSLFEDVVFSMIKKFKLKKEYDVERPSWTVFNFRHKNKDAQFAITFDERGHGDFLYGEVLAFGDEKDDIFKYKTDEVKVDSYNIEKECSNIIADCLAFIDTNKKITIFESKKSARKLIKESTNDDYWVFAVYPLDNGYLVNTDIKDYQYMEIKNGEIVNHSNSRESWFANKKKKAGYKDFDDYTDEELLDCYEKTVRKIIDRLGILTESKKSAKNSLKEAINDKTITINHHDYLLSGYGDSKNYKVDIIPDYDIFEEGMACDCTVDCYDYGDKASSPYTNMIEVHYKVWITPSGKTKSKLVLDETELIDKDDFDYLDDSVFVMICEWIDNHYGKELFESKKSVRKSIKESIEFYNDFGTGVYCATSSNGWTFCYCPLSWINKKGVEDLIGWSVMDDKAHYIDGDSWENKTDEEINDSIDNFEKLIKKYAKEDAKEIIKDFRSTLEK